MGEKVAALYVPLRRLMPDPSPPFSAGTEPGQWRPTDSLLGNPPVPAPFSTMAVPWVADTDPFTLTGPARFRAEPPPALTSSRYTTDDNEVKALEAFQGSSRTAEQADIAYFWSENFIAQWNRAVRGIRYARQQDRGQRAAFCAGKPCVGRCFHHGLGQ